MKQVRGLLLKDFSVTDYVWNGELDSLYDEIGCNLIDIAARSVGGVDATFVIDDEGLCTDECYVSAINSYREVMFVGNMFICNTTYGEDGGELSDITEEQRRAVMKNKIKVTWSDGTSRAVLTNVEY